MRFAYADPPYPGQAKRWYGDHPEYAGEVDHAELIARLEADYPDGWALSTSSTALQSVLSLCPATVRIAAWHVTNSEPPGNRRSSTVPTWHKVWEPVIVNGGRADPTPGALIVKNLLTAGNRSGFLGGRIAGEKPAAFTRWVQALLGVTPDDEIDDLFRGSGAVREVLAQQLLV